MATNDKPRSLVISGPRHGMRSHILESCLSLRNHTHDTHTCTHTCRQRSRSTKPCRTTCPLLAKIDADDVADHLLLRTESCPTSVLLVDGMVTPATHHHSISDSRPSTQASFKGVGCLGRKRCLIDLLDDRSCEFRSLCTRYCAVNAYWQVGGFVCCMNHCNCNPCRSPFRPKIEIPLPYMSC